MTFCFYDMKRNEPPEIYQLKIKSILPSSTWDQTWCFWVLLCDLQPQKGMWPREAWRAWSPGLGRVECSQPEARGCLRLHVPHSVPGVGLLLCSACWEATAHQMTQAAASLPWRPGLHSGLLISVWPSPGWCTHVRESTSRRRTSLLSFLSFQ